MKKLWPELWRHPVEILSGVVLAVLGVMMTVSATPDTVYRLYSGGIATTLGGILLSWTVSKTVSKSTALDDIRSELGLVSKTLGQAAGQVSRVVDQCIDHSLPAETGFLLIGQQAMLVGAQVSAIQGILGENFDSISLLQTITEVDNLAEQLDRKDRRASESEVADVRTRLNEIRVELTGAGPLQNRLHEEVVCPYCQTRQDAAIGAYPGDTATANCSKCGHRFNTHRRSDGSVFARTISGYTGQSEGNPNQRPRLTGNCPDCKGEISIFANTTGGPQMSVCLDCGASLIFAANRKTITTDGKFQQSSASIVGRYGSGGTGARPIVHCASCERDMRAIVRKSEAHFAIDYGCRILYKVTNSDFEEWRATN